jgi:CheY-like chemotaxis protein
LLFDAILTALNVPPEGGTPHLITRHTLRERRCKLRALVAEDNVVNQRLIRRMMEKWGHAVVVADNGLEALNAMEESPFDVVLMDVQMPEMDGFEATQAIRKRENGTGRHTLIIAMTAHAMKGDRQRCLDAGMDGYVAKPVQQDQLLDEMDRLLPEEARPRPDAPGGADAVPRGNDVVNLKSAGDRIGNDEELMTELICLFLESSPKWMEDLRQAVASADFVKVAHSSHSLKGAARSFDAVAVAQVADKMEMEAADGHIGHVQQLLVAMEEQLGRLTKALEAARQERRSANTDRGR